MSIVASKKQPQMMLVWSRDHRNCARGSFCGESHSHNVGHSPGLEDPQRHKEMELVLTSAIHRL